MSNHVIPLKVYFIIFGSLMVLTFLTVFVSFFNLGVLNTPVALAIAIFKASLVILYFMHVRYSSQLVQVSVIGGIFFMLILFVFTLSDYLTRAWVVQPAGWLP